MTETTAQNAWLTADVVLFGTREGTDHVLLIRRGWPPFEGRWALPGGHLDPGERAISAARRELAEETGITLVTFALTPVGVYAEPDRDPRGRYVTFAYTARLANLPQPAAGDDAAAVRWVPVADALAQPLAFDHHQIIRDALDLTR